MSSVQAPFWLGGVAASCAAACTHPLDLAKVRMQTTSPSGMIGQLGMLGTIGSTVSHNGFLSLYQGLSASIFRQLTYSMVRIGSYEVIKDWIAKGRKPTTSQLVLSGAIAGGLGGIAGNPADIVLVRMTSDSTLPPEQRRNYRHAFDGVLRMIREEGAKSLARGIGPNTLRAVLMTASQMASYDTTKSFLLSSPNESLRLKDGPLLYIISSGVSGLIATTICSPADVIKSRVMASRTCSVTEVIRSSLRQDGPRFLLKGWTPAFMRIAPNSVLLFVFLEQLKKAWAGSTAVSR